MNWVRNAILRWARNREPDFVIGGHESPYLLRHWLIPRNPVFNIYVHEFRRSDDDRALHDHPWLFNASWLLYGGYVEWVPSDGGLDGYLSQIGFERRAGEFKFRWGRAAHRVELRRDSANGPEISCWTVFITGPRVSEWGFYCPKGWVHWKRFTASNDPGSVGKGCDA